MAEERISVHICSNKCRCLREVKKGYSIVNGLSNGTYCSAYIHGTWQKIDPEKDCKGCKRAEYNGLSRTEAIERMAKAMWNRNQKQIARTNKEFVITMWETIERPSPNTQIFLEEAEAALDALIKGE